METLLKYYKNTFEKYKEHLTLKRESDNIEHMSMEERTQAYISRRIALLRGDDIPLAADEATEAYITRRIAELKGLKAAKHRIETHPYIQKRMVQLRNET